MASKYRALNDASRVARELLTGKVSPPTVQEFDTDYTPEPVCPHCGDSQGDAWELGDSARITCGHCELEFDCERQIEVTYSTSKIDYDAETAAEEKKRAETAARYAACQAFPPGTPVRIRENAGFNAQFRGKEGVVANRELSRHNPFVHVMVPVPGRPDREISAFPDEIERVR